MDKASEISQMRRMRILFFSFIFLLLAGVLLLILGAPFALGWSICAAGIVSGLVCAFTPCPCCSKPSGAFFKYMVGGVFPMGFCFHCGKSYLGNSGCGNDS